MQVSNLLEERNAQSTHATRRARQKRRRHDPKTLPQGTLEPGKLADMVIVDRNPLAIDPKTLVDVQVGVWVWSAFNKLGWSVRQGGVSGRVECQAGWSVRQGGVLG